MVKPDVVLEATFSISISLSSLRFVAGSFLGGGELGMIAPVGVLAANFSMSISLSSLRFVAGSNLLLLAFGITAVFLFFVWTTFPERATTGSRILSVSVVDLLVFTFPSVSLGRRLDKDMTFAGLKKDPMK